MTTPVTGRIHSTENFGTVDGPVSVLSYLHKGVA